MPVPECLLGTGSCRADVAALLFGEKTPMTTRVVPIDWNDLEMALTWRLPEGTHYLDMTSGRILASHDPDEEIEEDELEAGVAEGRFLVIEPVPTHVEHTWMEEFAASVRDPTFQPQLESALRGRGAFRRFKDTLLDRPLERERWFAFHEERLRAAAQEWLEDNGIVASPPPPPRDRRTP